jgi:tol-pal system protein YbgF
VRKPLVVTAGIALAACSSLTPVDDPVYLRITDVEARLIRIERVLENESLIALASDISSLRTEVQQLLGEVETLRFDLENQADGNRSLYLDLDERMSQIEAAQERLRSMPTAAGGGAAFGGASDQQAYDAAFALVETQDFETAQAAFEAFLAAYPQSGLRANAQYWLAETHYAQLSFETALAEFQQVVDEYPASAKLQDALVKIGFCHHELGDIDAAREVLLQVTRQFAGTSAAELADQRLTRIAAENR